MPSDYKKAAPKKKKKLKIIDEPVKKKAPPKKKKKLVIKDEPYQPPKILKRIVDKEKLKGKEGKKYKSKFIESMRDIKHKGGIRYRDQEKIYQVIRKNPATKTLIDTGRISSAPDYNKFVLEVMHGAAAIGDPDEAEYHYQYGEHMDNAYLRSQGYGLTD